MNTKEIIESMLKENTGVHMCDSGGTSGRHWQMNQGRDFESEPATVLKYDHDYISVVHNLYHWLNERLEATEDLTRAWKVMLRWKRLAGRGNDAHIQDALDFPTFYGMWRARKDECDREECETCLGDGWAIDEETGGNIRCEDCDTRGWNRSFVPKYRKNGFVARSSSSAYDDLGSDYVPAGIYGEGEPVLLYTYNEENLLSQDIQFVYFEMGGLEYVVLQIHNGADARGGLTAPHPFEVSSRGELMMFDYARGGIGCDGDHDHNWCTDDGNHWYYQGACGRGAGAQLETYDVVHIVDSEEWSEYHVLAGTKEAGDKVLVEYEGKSYVKEWVKGKLCVTEKEILCPKCGEKLSAGFF